MESFMDYILCRNCEQGNPAYLRFCSNCNADLFAENEEISALPTVEEESTESLRKMALTAIVVLIFTTTFKIWFLYSINDRRDFPTYQELSIIFTPIISAAVAAIKTNKWYRVMYVDLILIGLLFVFGLLLFLSVSIKDFLR